MTESLVQPPTSLPIRPLEELAAELVDRYANLCDGKAHWLSYHFGVGTRFGNSLIFALAECEARVPGLGARLIDDLYAVKHVPAAVDEAAWKARFEELIQKLAEVIVARALCTINWPDGTSVEYEPLNPTNKKRPEFSVTTPSQKLLFEVKCPAFISHQKDRSSNEHHLPVRSFMRDMPFLKGASVTLPRDNPIKDFLVSAQGKFENFDPAGVTGLLVVVWDEHMYEAIGALSHPMTGLLTPNSWYKKGGLPVAFPDVAGVIVINRLEQLKAGAQDVAEFPDVFKLGGRHSLPNTWHSNGTGGLDTALATAFDAVPFEAAGIAADYSMLDYVSWNEPAITRGQRLLRQQRRQKSLRELECSASAIAMSTSMIA